jgi:hypothetical protein
MMTDLLQLMPLSGEMMTRQFTAWLGSELPDGARIGRNPQPSELLQAFERAALDSMTVSEESSGKSWVIVVSDASGERLRIDAKQRGKEVENVLFTITGDRAVLEAILTHLRPSCGSYLITADGQNPSIVTSGQG